MPRTSAKLIEHFPGEIARYELFPNDERHDIWRLKISQRYVSASATISLSWASVRGGSTPGAGFGNWTQRCRAGSDGKRGPRFESPELRKQIRRIGSKQAVGRVYFVLDPA